MGDCVRIKLSTSKRGKLGAKNMAPVFSDVYIVKEVLGGAGGWTYLLTPANGVLKDKMRHFNNLRKAETGKAEEEVDEYTIIRTEPDRAETSKRKESDTKEQGYLVLNSLNSQANEGLTPYLAGQKYAIRFYD